MIYYKQLVLVWYNLHVHIPWDRTCKPAQASYVSVQARKDSSNMFRHHSVILRELVVSTLPSYEIMSNAAVGNRIYN